VIEETGPDADAVLTARISESSTISPDLVDELEFAPLANLSGRAETEAAKALVRQLADQYPRAGKSDSIKAYRQVKKRAGFETAIAAFLAELLAAYGDERRGGWLRCSLDKDERKGHRVTWSQFRNVREAWVAGRLVDIVKGYPGMLAFGNPGPTHGKMTRYKATPTLLALCAEYGVTPDNVDEHFGIEYEMPSELVQLTSPSRRTPDNPKVFKLREEVAELNEFFAKHTLTHPKIRHIGWVRKFHLSNRPDFRWNKGGRLYSQPPGKKSNYQNVNEDTRLGMKLDGRYVAEIDLGSSYLSIFYAWNDLQLDTKIDAYEGILGPSKVDRQVAKFWINASFGNSTLIQKWSKDLKDDLQGKLIDKGLAPSFDPKSYPIRVVKENVLQRHPLLERWGGKIRGRVRDWGDLMFTESEVIIGSMLILMKEHGIPSMPVHDSLIVPSHRIAVALEVLRDRFRAETGMLPRLDVNDPWDF
jgi:ribosomal protein L17